MFRKRWAVCRAGVWALLLAGLAGCGGGEEADSPPEGAQEALEAVAPDSAGPDTAAVSIQSAPAESAMAVEVAPPAPQEREEVVFSARGRYLLQVGAYRNRASAEAVGKKLRARGYPAQVVPSGEVFRVRIGFFGTVAEAKALGERLKADMGLAYWVDNR